MSTAPSVTSSTRWSARRVVVPADSAAHGVLVVGAVLVLPVLLYVAHLAPLARFAYPLGNFALACWLFARRSPWYAAHCLLIFCFVSLVRRLVDEQAGFDPVNPVLFTPYLCSLFAGLAFLEYWSRPRPVHIGAFLLLVGGALYGGVLAALDGRLISGAVDALKWMAGPLFAAYALARDDARGAQRALLENALVAAATAMSLYGVWQFVRPATWDALWMQGVAELGMDSIGVPEPFSLRVFSTMNSPGSFGSILLAAILVALKKPLGISIPAISCMLIGLGLCQYRTIWAATALGLCVLALLRPRAAFAPRNLLAIGAVLLALSATALLPEVRDTIGKRANSMNELKSDRSGEERLNQYRDLMSEDGLIAGEGLGLSGAMRRLDGLPRAISDSGLIDTWRSLGVVVGSAYLGALVLLCARALAPATAGAADLDFDRTIAVTTFVQLPMGSVHIGEMGFCAWLFLGLALAARRGGRA